ncbi:MAG TPA: hypothetical protein VM925_35775, partial [Labilithrix sp.]|nr:hypothetical protein [Labilithrix sp.]
AERPEPAPARPAPKAAPAAKTATPPVAAPRAAKAAEPKNARDTSLPNLDRAAAAAGLTPTTDDTARPTDSAPSQAEEGNKEEQKAPSSTTSPNAEDVPDLQIKR